MGGKGNMENPETSYLEVIRESINKADTALLYRLASFSKLPPNFIHFREEEFDYSSADQRTLPEIRELVDRRFDLTSQVALHKYEHVVGRIEDGSAVAEFFSNGSTDIKQDIFTVKIFYPDREEQIIQRLQKEAETAGIPLEADYIRKMWKELFRVSCIGQEMAIKRKIEQDKFSRAIGPLVAKIRIVNFVESKEETE